MLLASLLSTKDFVSENLYKQIIRPVEMDKDNSKSILFMKSAPNYIRAIY